MMQASDLRDGDHPSDPAWHDRAWVWTRFHRGAKDAIQLAPQGLFRKNRWGHYESCHKHSTRERGSVA
jgi:hypothetical protein